MRHTITQTPKQRLYNAALVAQTRVKNINILIFYSYERQKSIKLVVHSTSPFFDLSPLRIKLTTNDK